MAKFRQILLLLGIMVMLFALSARSQTNTFLKPVRVAGGSYVSLNDSLVYFKNDTVIYISDSYLPRDTNVYNQTVIFYDSLKAKAERKNFTKILYDLVVIPPARVSSSGINKRNIDQFADHSGKIIRNIYIRRLNAFGTTINDPESSIENESEYFLNKTHIKTREYIIRNYLVVEENDSLVPLKISESERILRQLPYIYDARIIIIPISSTEVDIMVVTKDIYSLGLMTDIKNLNVGTVSIFDKDLFGFGHELEIKIPYDYEKYNSAGFGTAYTLKNISQTMIDLKLEYRNAFNRKQAGFDASRKFFSPYTKYAGGLSVNEIYVLEDLDTLAIPEPVEFNNFDLWFGRSFLIDNNFTRAVISGRYINNNVWNRPEITSNSYYEYQKYKMYLVSFSLVSQRFYKSNLIYNYGRNEDIPYGGILEITYGKEYNEFNTRDYLAIESAFGDFVPNAGYLYGRGIISTFIKDNVTEQGLLHLNFKYISDLHNLRSYKLRLFGTLDYTRGFKRFNDEYLPVGEDYGIRGFKNDSLFPDQRLYLNLEAVAFSKAFIYGFRFAFFGFADIVLFSKDKIFYEYDNLVSGFGIGLRVRNENLIFNTFQIRFGIYPGAPPNSIMRYIDVAGERLLNPPGFDPGAPGIIDFR
ncbi:MAG TPA: hypothetical protein ENH59_02360 [Bacteroidetes bacterium]|nr:hypothetical protein [Bacteroidota bacterium]